MAQNTQPMDLFHQFVAEMNELLCDVDVSDVAVQRKQFNELFSLETQFRDLLLKTPGGRKIYANFIHYILHDVGNILSARVYFRERQRMFSRCIVKAFYKQDPTKLYKLRINYKFISWALKQYKGIHKKKLTKLFEQIVKQRNIIIQNNLLLAINRAKIFWSRTVSHNLEYMDLIQTAIEGLITAIDKFVPPYRTVFRSVAIGRMTVNMISQNSETLLKFSPAEKRVLYRANCAKSRYNMVDDKDITRYVNQSFDNITPSILNNLMNAAANVSSEDAEYYTKIMSSPNAYDEYDRIITDESIQKCHNLLSHLSIIEYKVICLTYGINLSQFSS